MNGTTRNTALIAQMKEIGANLLARCEHIGRAHVVGGEPADCLDADVTVSVSSKTGKNPHVVDHTLTQRGRMVVLKRSSSRHQVDLIAPAPERDTRTRSPQRLGTPYGEAVAVQPLAEVSKSGLEL